MSLLNLSEYLIDQTGKDWQTLMSAWAEILPPTFTVWLVNRFGDLITVLDDGSVHRLDIGGGTFKRVAESGEHFGDQIDIAENANDWLMIPLAMQCMEAGISLGPSQCYGFKNPPLLGGEYTALNVVAVDLAENYAFLADLWHQTKDLPDGSTVKLVIKP